jgi:uncharacterized protein YukE
LAKLRIDLDVLDATISTYNTEISNIKRAKVQVQNALNLLSSSGWDSQASKTWFSLLDDEWLKNIDYQIRVLERLRDNLRIAKSEYLAVVEERDKLTSDL